MADPSARLLALAHGAPQAQTTEAPPKRLPPLQAAQLNAKVKAERRNHRRHWLFHRAGRRLVEKSDTRPRSGGQLDRGDWEQREVYAHFGVAIYFCQVVESALVNYLLLLRRATTAREITETEIDEMFVELFGNTLGGTQEREAHSRRAQ